jgi:hypothetical protein
VCDHRLVIPQGETAIAAAEAIDEPTIGESRWPPAIALFCFLVLNIAMRVWLPGGSPVRVPWLIPTIEGVLLVALVASDHSGVATRRHWLRPLCVGLVILLVTAALWGTILLVHDLVHGSTLTNSPTKLLASGALTWVGNNVAFALLYWLMDSGGPIARAQGAPVRDFAFTQQMSPELAPEGWRPVFLDYLHLGFTNATAFSPTDVMPLTHRAKYAMVVQSSVALALFGLIVARAVNSFT